MPDDKTLAVALVLGLLPAGACGTPSQTPGEAAPDGARQVAADPSTPRAGASSSAEAPFVERALESGIDFVHFNGMSGEHYFAEPVGSGGALFDYDNDGDLDVYLVQGSMLGPDKQIGDATFPPPARLPLGDRLFRNQLRETGALRFVDVTEQAGILSTGYGMGVAAGDFDGDGWVDLYITNFGPNLLLRNNGDGTFEDVTARSGAVEDRWSTSAAFVDVDGDGLLDLFVCNYVDFSFANHKPCYAASSARDYCGATVFQPLPDRLFRNLGGGVFEDVTASSQIARHYGAGLGVVAADLTGDGLVDIYVANDDHPNQFWVNLGDGTFRDDSLLSGCALNEDGRTEASMGVDAADFDGDGDEDLFMTHLRDETNTLYRNDGTGVFEDFTFEVGLGVASRAYTSFGTAWVDYDNDGWLDLVIANGAVTTIEALARRGDPYPLHHTNQIFRNRGGDRFEEVTDRAGEAFRVSEVSRGAAFGDLDNDGDTDVLIVNNSGPARLLVNEVGNRNSWIGLRMMDRDGRSDLLNTRVEVVREDGTSLRRRVRVAASYCSSNDPRVLLGLGRDPSIRSVRARWPDGELEEWTDLAVGRYTSLRQGSGSPRSE
ncbi:MAG: CRTAC1 family protein [Planctomycetota bacterium]|jgi:hypothetical protein